MAKGKHIVVDGASDKDCNLEDDYYDLFANNVDLEGEKDEANLDGVVELASSEINGIEFDGGDFDGAGLDGDDFDGIGKYGANLVAPNIDVPDNSNSRKGVNMDVRQNKKLKTKREKLWCNTMKWVFLQEMKPLSWLLFLAYWLVHQFQFFIPIGVRFLQRERSVCGNLFW